VQVVRAVRAGDGVGAVVTVRLVVPRPGIDAVVTRPAQHKVVSRARFDRVVADVAEDVVHAEPAQQDVVTAAAEDRDALERGVEAVVEAVPIVPVREVDAHRPDARAVAAHRRRRSRGGALRGHRRDRGGAGVGDGEAARVGGHLQVVGLVGPGLVREQLGLADRLHEDRRGPGRLRSAHEQQRADHAQP
jgi:hypothetical protein